MAKTIDEIVIEVLDGRWGSGNTRKNNLIKAGYDYNAIQNRINEVVAHMNTRKQALKPWFDACKAQWEWSYNSKYNWGKWEKTVASSKNYGTCIVYPNCVAMRCKLIKEKGKIITSTGSNNDSLSTQNSFYNNSLKAMASINSKYWSSIKFPNKTLKALVKDGSIKEGDIIGFMGHTTMFAEKDSKGNLLFNNAGHAAGIYDNNKAGSNRAVLNKAINSYGNRIVLGIFSVNTFYVLTSCKGGTISYSNRYMAGQDVKVTITPSNGNVISSIKVDGKTVAVTNSYTISKIDANHIIEVVCSKGKTIDEIAREVLDGKWGSGDARKTKLTQAGYNYDAVQKRVNELLAPKPVTKTIDELAQEVLDGKWGSGDARKANLEKAGYDYNAVQNKVNELINKSKPYQNLKESDYIGGDVVRIGQATSNEKGELTGGSAGDQNGKEVAMANWSYASGDKYNSWKHVFRAKDTAARLKIAQAAIDACNNNHIGYDTGSSDRKSCFKEAQKIHFDLSKVAVNCETTCSELANVCIAAAGLSSYLPVNKAAYVESLTSQLSSSSEFTDNKSYATTSVNLLPGDIIISGSHTAIVVKVPVKKTVDQLAKEVLDGKWGSGDARKKNLENAGYDYNAVQNKVNELLAPKTVTKSVAELAQEVLDGKWGSGDVRKTNLTKAGYDYNAVQAKVNELLASKTTSQGYTGTLPTLKIVKSNAQVIADAIVWAKWIAADNNFHYGYTSPDKKANAHHNGCYFCGTQRMKKNMLMPEHTYCCNPFVGAAWAHGGCVPAALKLCQNTNSWGFSKGSGYDKSSLFTNLGHPDKSKLKAGDVLCRDTHVALYIGDGKLVEAGGGDDNKKNSTKWNNSIHVAVLTDARYKNFPRVHRFNGSVNTSMILRHGEVSDRVGQWQAFLDWYFDGKVGKADRCFGDNTLKWTKKFQEEAIGKGEGDGLVGEKTLAAAKAIKKKVVKK